MRARLWLVMAAALALLGLVGAGCGSNDSSDKQGNLLENGSFSQGSSGWTYLRESPDWRGFTISDRVAFDEPNSAELQLVARSQDFESRIWGLVQDLDVDHIPKTISGYYRVDDWKRATRDQYLQFVVILIGNFTSEPNLQIRYALTGIEEPPFNIENARYVFLGKTVPKLHKWIHFQRNLQQDFAKLWASQKKKDVDKIRVLFETRYDNKETGNSGNATVYYDKLFLGD